MRIALLLLAAVALRGQTAAPPKTALLSAAEAAQLEKRMEQLMESTAVAVPGLSKASATIAENARQSLTVMQAAPNNAGLVYDFLREVRAYLALFEALPKPFPFPDTAQKQYSELRDSVDRLALHLRAQMDRVATEVRNPDRDNLKRYADANSKLNPPAANFARVIFMGDSITDFWRINEYFTGRDYINRGISGQITGEMLGRMKQDVIDLHPKAMLILAGTNDFARGVAISTIENNLSMIGDLCKANNIKPLFSSILPVSDYHKAENAQNERTKTRPPASIVEVNTWLQEYCRTHNYIYVDYYSALKDASGMLPADAADDGLHPNAKGYRMMAPIAQKALDRALAETHAAPPPAAITQQRPAQPATPHRRTTLFGK